MTTWTLFATYLRARLGDTERGAALVEYALIVALLAVGAIGAVTFLGRMGSARFASVGSSIS